jgi:hypothetical protein
LASLFSDHAPTVNRRPNPAARATKVAEQNAEWTHRKQIELDDVKYKIAVSESGGEYSAMWTCLACGEHGASALKSATPEQAIERAETNLYAHHTLAHSESTGG